MHNIVQRTADAMVAEGCPFRGVLFAGLMIKDGTARLLEHNVRFGDPECQVLMMRLESDLLEVLLAACEGRLADITVQWSPQVRSSPAQQIYVGRLGSTSSYCRLRRQL
jgi:phosphoribosylamine--glycine ligase